MQHFNLSVCLSCSMTTQQPYTKDESLHLMSPTNSVFFFHLLPHSPHLSLQPCPSRPLSQHRADYRQRQASDATAVQRLRRFNFLLFIVATQTTFKLLPFRPVPLPSRPNLRLSRPKIFTAQQSPDDLPSLKSGESSNLGLMGCVELKTRQLQ